MTAQCLVFFLAGFETSSTTMTFALFEMSLNPEIQEKVREELSRVLKKYDNKICYESAKELDYMQQVIDGKYKIIYKFVDLKILFLIEPVLLVIHLFRNSSEVSTCADNY